MSAVPFALLSALCTAANLVFQHQASGEAPAAAGHGWRLLRHLAVQPLWLVGLAVMAVGFVCHAVALHFGQLSLVQPLLVTELVFVLVLRRIRTKERLGWRPWIAAAVTCVGLATLLVVADPSQSSTVPTTRGWVTAIVVIAMLAGGSALLARLGPPVQSTFRPQEALTAQVLYGAVNAIRAMRPEFVIQGGDLIDNDQNNELTHALRLLNGGRVDPGSGPDGWYGSLSDR